MGALIYREQRIEYELRREERETLAVTVRPDGSVLVQAPLAAAEDDVHRRLKRRALWILRQKTFFEQFEPRTPPREYVRGESHLFLGRNYRLRLIQEQPAGVHVSGGYLCVRAPDRSDREAIRDAIRSWYASQARLIFPERLARCLQRPAVRKLAGPPLQVRWMRKRWGSLTPSGVLILNVDLIRAPRTCIDYVITHELCHVHHSNHSREFFRLLHLTMPDWEERKIRLERLLS